jgi:tryptophan-rich sensory protein
VNAYLFALLACTAAAIFEGLCAGKEPLKKLAQLRQPLWSPPTWVWVLIGLYWYGICFTALARLLPHWPVSAAAVFLLCAMMLANGAVNIFQFRMRRLDLAFFSLFPYWLLLLGPFLWTACTFDGLVCALFAVYALYQIYAASWGYRVWRMNQFGN